MTIERAAITSTVEIALNVDTAARWFAYLTDDQKTKFLVMVAAELKRLDPVLVARHLDAVGGHLRWCTCATTEARELIRTLARAIETSEHGRDGALAVAAD